MTEAEWLHCIDPHPMLQFLRGSVSERRLRLFACACCRRLLKWSGGEGLDLDVAERFADGRATRTELARARQASARQGSFIWWKTSDPEFQGDICAAEAFAAAASLPWPRWVPLTQHYTAIVVKAAVAAAASGWGWGGDLSREQAAQGERAAQAGLLRDIVGNPFHPALALGCLLSVASLAQAAYDARTLPSGHLDPSRLAILADALERSGCKNSDLLGHLRDPGPHVRGCWAVDLVLNKS
jgi:hypothetical protein